MISIRVTFLLLNNTENGVFSCQKKKMIRLKNSRIRSYCKARSSVSTLVGFPAVFTNTNKTWQENYDQEKNLQVQNHFYPVYKSQRRLTHQVRIPSGSGGYLYDVSQLLTAVEPRDILPESKCLWLSVSDEGTNNVFLSIWCHTYSLRIYFVQVWGSKGQSYPFLTKKAGSMPGASQYLISRNDHKRPVTVFSCYDEKTQRG